MLCLKTPFQTIHDAHFLWILFLIVTGGFFQTLTGPYLTRLHKQNSVRNAKRWVVKQKLFDKKTNKFNPRLQEFSKDCLQAQPTLVFLRDSW